MQAIFSLVVALAIAPAAWPSDFGPWRFGMSKDEVQSFTELGPYRVSRTAIWRPTEPSSKGTRKTSSFSSASPAYDVSGSTCMRVQIWTLRCKNGNTPLTCS